MANNLSGFNPFNEISRFEPLKNLDEFFNNYRSAAPWSSREPEPRIKIDVSETDDAYLVKADRRVSRKKRSRSRSKATS